MEHEHIRRLPDGGAIVSQGLKPLPNIRHPDRRPTNTSRLVALVVKIALAACTFGLYPVIPWLHRGITATVNELHTRSAADRYATYQAGRQRYQQRRAGLRKR